MPEKNQQITKYYNLCTPNKKTVAVVLSENIYPPELKNDNAITETPVKKQTHTEIQDYLNII